MPVRQMAAPARAAAMGARGQVWANKGSKTCHCKGVKSQVKTRTGGCMTEAAARVKGRHADHCKTGPG